MGGDSEREYMEKIGKIKEKLLKAEKDVKNDFEKIEKIKLEALKKTEEMRRSAEHDLGNVEKNVVKSKNLAMESRQRLSQEITILGREIGEKYTEMKTRISKAIAPEQA
jgi:hypothetical protein